MLQTANIIRGLVTALLVTAALVAFAGPGWTTAFAPVNTAWSFPPSLGDTTSPDKRGVVVPAALTAADATKRPCDGRGASPGMARCPTAVPCITVCGGLPNTAFAVPPPSVAGADKHARATDDPSRGITTLPDPPPPRLSA